MAKRNPYTERDPYTGALELTAEECRAELDALEELADLATAPPEEISRLAAEGLALLVLEGLARGSA